MSTNVQDLKDELRSLPVKQRAELAHFLIESLENSADDDAEQAWDAEIDRRAGEIRSGHATGVPANEVFARLREKYP